ncbi:hypothetical protein ACLOJK_010193 [Asimina triloba]
MAYLKQLIQKSECTAGAPSSGAPSSPIEHINGWQPPADDKLRRRDSGSNGDVPSASIRSPAATHESGSRRGRAATAMIDPSSQPRPTASRTHRLPPAQIQRPPSQFRPSAQADLHHQRLWQQKMGQHLSFLPLAMEDDHHAHDPQPASVDDLSLSDPCHPTLSSSRTISSSHFPHSTPQRHHGQPCPQLTCRRPSLRPRCRPRWQIPISDSRRHCPSICLHHASGNTHQQASCTLAPASVRPPSTIATRRPFHPVTSGDRSGTRLRQHALSAIHHRWRRTFHSLRQQHGPPQSHEPACISAHNPTSQPPKHLASANGSKRKEN